MILELAATGLRGAAGLAVAAADAVARGQAVLAAADTTPAPQDIDPTTGHGPEWGKAAPIGLLVIVLLCIAGYFLARSMNRHLKRVPASFVPGSAGAPSDAQAGGTLPGGALAGGTQLDATQPGGTQPVGPPTADGAGPPAAPGEVSAVRSNAGEPGSDDADAPPAGGRRAAPEPDESAPAAARGPAEHG